MNSFSIIISTLMDCLYMINDEYRLKNDDPYTYFICDKFISEKKYHVYDNYIIRAPFISDEKKRIFVEYFLTSQKIYRALCRFARKYKVTRSIKFNTGTDLCLNDISNISELSTIKLYVDSSRVLYTFRTSDVIQVINAALTYNANFFAEPQTIKNPYTNIPFTNAELYSIYYSIKYSHFEMPFLFHQYLINGFSLIRFTCLNETILREIAITDFCKSSTNRQKYNYISRMLVEFSDIFCPSNIDSEFPKENVVDAFKYLLKDTLTMSFSLINTLRKASKQNIKRELREFKKYNPMYGRKIIVRKYTNIDNKPFIFGDKNRSFTIQHKFIDTVVTKKPIIPRKINTNRRASNRRNRLLRNRRILQQRTNADGGIQAAFTYSSPTLSVLTENIIIDGSMNLPSVASNISTTNITYNSFTYNDISSGESDDETITSIDSTNESIHLIDEESSSDESSY